MPIRQLIPSNFGEKGTLFWVFFYVIKKCIKRSTSSTIGVEKSFTQKAIESKKEQKLREEEEEGT